MEEKRESKTCNILEGPYNQSFRKHFIKREVLKSMCQNNKGQEICSNAVVPFTQNEQIIK